MIVGVLAPAKINRTGTGMEDAPLPLASDNSRFGRKPDPREGAGATKLTWLHRDLPPAEEATVAGLSEASA
jgi:hypothetical protein